MHRQPPMVVRVALIAGVLAGCAQTGAPRVPPAAQPSFVAAPDSVMPPDVAGVAWQWVSLTTPVDSVTVDAPERYTVRFDTAGRIAVRADCNRGSAPYAVTADRRLTFGPLALTKVACPPGSLSNRYARDLGRATRYFLKGGDLYLDLPVDSGTMRFRRPPGG